MSVPFSVEKNPTWTFAEVKRNVHTLTFDTRKEARLLLISDEHWDNPHCNRDKLEEDMSEAVRINAPIVSVGDFYCAMQGKWDKRSSKSDVRPEHQCGHYLDSLVDTAVEWHKPYQNHVVLRGLGNHETAIKKHHETDLIDRLCSGIRANGGITRAGGYGGFVRLLFRRPSTPSSPKGQTLGLDLYYHHGFGGGGPITQGAIDWSRYLMQVGADVYVSGHVHYHNTQTISRARLTQNNTITTSPILFVRCSTYKEEWVDGHSGFHVEKGRGPRPIGGQWLHLRVDGDWSYMTATAISTV